MWGQWDMYNWPDANNCPFVRIVQYAFYIRPPKHYTLHKLIRILGIVISRNKSKCNVQWCFKMKRDQWLHSLYGNTKVFSNPFVLCKFLTPHWEKISPILLLSMHISSNTDIVQLCTI